MRALAKIKPTREERKKIKALAGKIIKQIRIKGTKTILGGSAAKGTNLRGAHDLDIYVKFDKNLYADVDISAVLKEELEKVFPHLETVHGSRDYYQINEEGFLIELIPILNIRKAEDADNITDISPLHVKWVRKHRWYSDEIRMAKAFCKANHVYGAETYVKGFSGYVLEILTVHYKSFKKLLQAATKWKKKEIIDPEKHYPNEKAVLKELNAAKSLSPLIVIDPVQKSRNVAAVVSKEKYQKFILLARKYLKNPAEHFFEKKEFSISNLKKKARGNKLIILEAEALDGKKDIVGTKLLKCLEYLRKKLRVEGFKVFKSGWHWEGKAVFWLIVSKENLPELKKHFGPPPKEEKRLESFKEKWKGYKVYSEKGCVYIKLERKFRDAEGFLDNLIKEDDYVKSKVKQIVLANLE